MWLSESSLQQPLPWKPFQPSLLPLLHQFPIWEIQEWVPVFSWGSCSFFSQAQRAPHGVSEQGTILPHHSPWGGKQHLHYCHQSQGEPSWHIIRKARTAFVLSYSPRFVLFSVCVLCKKKDDYCYILPFGHFVFSIKPNNTWILCVPTRQPFPNICPSLGDSSFND